MMAMAPHRLIISPYPMPIRALDIVNSVWAVVLSTVKVCENLNIG